MQKYDIRQYSIYIILISINLIISFYSSVILKNVIILSVYRKISLFIPFLFIISAFLAYRTAETRIVLLNLVILIISSAGPLVNVLLPLLGRELPEIFKTSPKGFYNISLLFPFAYVLIFSFPDRIGRYSLLIPKIVLAAGAFLFSGFYPGATAVHTDILANLPILSLEAAAVLFSLFPAVLPLITGSRRTYTLAPAVSASMLMISIPAILNFSSFLYNLCFLTAGIIQLHSLYRIYWDNSYIDELTGLLNRRALDERLHKLTRAYTLSMSDIDHFKNFNDTYGHDSGDNVLRLVAKILYNHFGRSAYRYGGEEFCVIFRKTELKQAASLMDNARKSIAEHSFYIRQDSKNRKKSGRNKTGRSAKKVEINISAGVAQPGSSAVSAFDVLKNADTALYAAKKNGRNRVEMSRKR